MPHATAGARLRPRRCTATRARMPAPERIVAAVALRSSPDCAIRLAATAVPRSAKLARNANRLEDRAAPVRALCTVVSQVSRKQPRARATGGMAGNTDPERLQHAT